MINVPAQPTGSVGLIHLESHFTDEKAGRLRAETYSRLRRHWQFINELKLFEIQDQKRFGINVYGGSRDPKFLQAASLYHPDTVVRSLKHDGSGTEPGIKDLDGNWDVRPHASRIVLVTHETLGSWHAVLETSDVPLEQTRMVYAVNKSTAAVLEKLAEAPRFSSLGLQFSPGWHEKNDRTKGYFDSEWGVPESWDSVILQGPHLYVGTPLYKTPNPTMLHHLDWTETDLETLEPDAVPATSYKPRGDRAKYDAAYTHWKTEPAGSATPSAPSRSFYRIAWRRMAANTGERTLIPALVPPGPALIQTVGAAAVTSSPRTTALVHGVLQSLVADFAVRVTPKADILFSTIERLPYGIEPFAQEILLRTLRLNCVTSAYSDLWEECFSDDFLTDDWAIDDGRVSRAELAPLSRVWTETVPLRVAADRRRALVEIDAMVAIATGVSAKELSTLYRTQFPVLYGYDTRSTFYDANGRVVPTSVLQAWRKDTQNSGSFDQFSRVHPSSGREYRYITPFTTLDRDAHLQDAYAKFAQRVADRI